MDDLNYHDGNNRISGYDHARMIGTLLVIAGHSCLISIGNGNLYGQIENASKAVIFFEWIRRAIYSFHMPFFVMISGAVFYISRSHNSSITRQICKSIRLIFYYFITAVFLLVPVRYVVGYYMPGDRSIFKVIFYDVIYSFDVNYLWYLVMLAEISLIYSIVLKVINVEIMINRILIIVGALFISIFQYGLNNVLPFQLNRTMEFMFWFYVGILFEINRVKILKQITAHTQIILFVLFVISFVVFYIFDAWQQNIEEHVIGIKIMKMLMRYIQSGTMSAIMIKKAFDIDMNNRFLRWIESHSLSLYLYHVPFMFLVSWFLYINIPAKDINNVSYTIMLFIRFLSGLGGAYLIIIFSEFLSKRGTVFARERK